MEHEAAPTAKAALLLVVGIVKLLVDKKLLSDADLPGLMTSVANSASGQDDEAAVISMLNHLIEKPR